MKLVSTIIAAVVISLCASYAGAVDWSVGVKLSDGSGNSFYASVSDYYKVSDKQVSMVKSRNLADDEVPVAFFLAQKTGVKVETIVNLKLQGMSWLDITLKYGKDPGIFYVPVEEKKGPPYGKAHGYYKNKPKDGWKSVKLSNDEIIDLVNIRFISEHHGWSADEVEGMRRTGKHYSDIDSDIKEKKKGKGNNKKEKKEKHDKDKDDDDKEHGKGNKGKGKHKD